MSLDSFLVHVWGLSIKGFHVPIHLNKATKNDKRKKCWVHKFVDKEVKAGLEKRNLKTKWEDVRWNYSSPL